MTANVHEKTGIPYGVVNGNSVMDLMDEITAQGDDLSYAAFKSDLEARVAGAIRGVVENHCGDSAEIVGGIDCAEIVESLLDSGLHVELEECEYTYTNGATKYRLGWLGGAPLIWILESEFVAYSPVCSPCVPNAGDLDNLGAGILCYCCPPEDFDDDEYGIVGEVVHNGKTYRIVGKVS